MRRTARWLAFIGGALLLTAALLIGLVWTAGDSTAGRALIEKLTDRLTGGQVRLSGLQGSWPAHLRLAQLRLSDERGVWLVADDLRVDWTPLALLSGRVQVSSLEAAHVRFARLPVPSSQARRTKASIPDIDVRAASIRLFELGAELAGIPAALEAHGGVHLRSLDDMSIDMEARGLGADGRYDLHLRFDPARLDASLDLQEPAGGPFEHIVGLPGLGALHATATLAGPRSALDFAMRLDAGELHGHAQGHVDLAAQAADFDYALASPALQPRPDLGWQALSLKGRWHGTFSEPVADGDLDIVALRNPAGVNVDRLEAKLTAGAGLLTIHASVDGVRVPGPSPLLLAREPLHVEAEWRLNQPARPLHLRATSRLFTLDAQADTRGKPHLDAKLEIADLAPFAALAGTELRGTASLTASAAYADDATSFDIAADGRLAPATSRGAQGGSAGSLIAALGIRPTLKAAGSWRGGGFVVDRMLLEGRAGRVSASGTVDRTAAGALADVDGRWSVDVADLTALSPALAGTLRASGRLGGREGAFAVDADIDTLVSIHGSAPGRVSAEVHGSGLPRAPSGTIRVKGMLDAAPVVLDAQVARDAHGAIRAEIRHGTWKSVHLNGDLRSGAAVAAAHTQLELHVADLGDFDRLLGISLQGSLDLTGAGSWSSLELKLGAHVVDLSGADAALDASASLDLDRRALDVADLKATYRQFAVDLGAPALVAFEDGLRVDGLVLNLRRLPVPGPLESTAAALPPPPQAAPTRVQFVGRLLPQLDAHLVIEAAEPALIDAFAPGLLGAGTLAAHADLTGSLAHPQGHVQVDAVGLRFAVESAAVLPALNVHASAELAGDTAVIGGELSAGKNSEISVTGSAPLALGGALALKLAGSLDVALASPMLEAHGLQVAGELAVDARVSGTPAAPDIDGTIRVSRGIVRDYVRGFSLTQITAVLSGAQGRLRIDECTAHAGSGTLTMTGSLGLLEPQVPLSIKIHARNAEPIASSLVTANLDADIDVDGTARERLDVVGTIHINRAEIGIPSSLPPNVAVLDVRRRGAPAAPPAQRTLVVGLGLAVHAPNEVIVQGRGLDAEFGGDLEIKGTTAAPVVNGGFELQRGSFSIAGKSLTFSPPSRVSFDGTDLGGKLDPTLDFTAQSDLADNSTATLRITGLADAPRFDFSSSPDMPQNEIIAELLFGKSASQLSGFEAAQIAASLAILSGVGGGASGLNALAKLQKNLGLDRLNVGANTTTTATGTTTSGYNVAAGRYVAKRVYVEAKQSTTGSTQVQVDVDLTKHLKLQTRLGDGSAITQGTTPENDPGSSVGLSYQIEY
jgi:translocation and assembly module TamB